MVFTLDASSPFLSTHDEFQGSVQETRLIDVLQLKFIRLICGKDEVGDAVATH